MNRDKQIEDLAKAIFLNCHCGLFEDEAKMIAKFCYQEIDRKATEVAKNIFEEIEKYVEVALMNGHIETPILCIGHGTFAELKKKYTEGEE